MEKGTKSVFACWVAENLSEFEMTTPEAQTLKQELRKWYYGDRDPVQAEELMDRFNALFTFNMFTGLLGAPIWALADRSIMAETPELTQGLSGVPRGSVVGRCIRVYGGLTGLWRDRNALQSQFQRLSEDTAQRVAPALNALQMLYRQEAAWYRVHGMSWGGLLTALLGLAALLCGLSKLLPCVIMLLSGTPLLEIAMRQRICGSSGPKAALVLLLVCLLCTVVLLILLPRLLVTLRAGLVWAFGQGPEFGRRRRLLEQIRRSVEMDHFSVYRDALLQCAGEVLSMPPEAPLGQDPSRALLGAAGMERAFHSICPQVLPPFRDRMDYCLRLSARYLRSRALAVVTVLILLASLLLLNRAWM